MSELGPDSSIRELFEEIQVDAGANVVPVAVSKAEDDIARLMICICGAQEEARLIFANLMTYVDQMYAASKQEEANAEAENDSSIIVS